MTKDYRSIWQEAFGDIPKDANDRTFEIHHIDGNHENNALSNLMCLSIDDHYNIHFQQGDYAACHLIAKRKATSTKELSEIISSLNKLRTGNKNPFFGKKHTQETKSAISAKLSGEKHPFFGKKRPEFAKKVSLALKGKIRSEEHSNNIRKAKLGKASKQYKYTIEHDESRFEIINLKQFCRDNSLPYHKMRLPGTRCNGYRVLL